MTYRNRRKRVDWSKMKQEKKQKHEIHYGSSFLSQSSRFLNIGNNIVSAEIKDSKGNLRTISLQ